MPILFCFLENEAETEVIHMIILNITCKKEAQAVYLIFEPRRRSKEYEVLLPPYLKMSCGILTAISSYAFLFIFTTSFLIYILHHLIVAVWYKTQNLKRRYSAEWALVTGSSSGDQF
jgi:hypothetical protein